MTTSDMQLLREYVTGNSEEAFGALVSRHVNLVYSVALRVLRDSHQAEEVSQSVFLTLARKGGSLDSETILSGWLYHTARLTASNFIRGEMRRRHREEQAQQEAAMNENESGPDVWAQVGPQLEEAMAELNDKDRDAIVLRFFEDKRLREVGDALGLSEDAAKMRVTRALEKLRNFFTGRGITLPEALLAAALTGNSVVAAPAGLGATITTGVMQGAAAGTAVTGTTIAKGALYTMSTAKIGVAIGVCAAAAVIAFQWHQVQTEKKATAQLQAQLVTQTQTADAQAKQIKQLQDEVATFRKSVESMARDAAKSRANATAAREARSMAEAAKKAAAAGGGNGLQALFKDPDMVKAMKEQSAAMVRQQYAPLVKQLHLSDDKAEAFYQILIDKSTAGITALQSGNISAASTNSVEPQLRALLGDDGYAQYQNYTSTLADQTMLNQYKTSFVDEPLTDQQQQQLLQVMISARQNTPATAPDYSTLNAAGQAAVMQDAMDRQATINSNVLQQAQAFLSPSQLQTLGTSQSNFLNMEKVGMTLAQKMFTNGPAGASTAQAQ
jgi:RNA polymerase sigma factor (sigma-70 family)